MAKRLKQPWDPCRETLTEFGPLSSDVKPSGNFITRLLKRKNDSGNGSGSSSATNSQTSSRETSVERSLAPSETSTPPGSFSSPPDLVSQSSISRENTPDRDAEDSDGSNHSGLEALSHSLPRRMPKRTLSSVLSRLSNILDRSSSQTPQAYKDSDFKQFWMPDSSCRECYNCGDKFTTFRRRHHCRICGQIFCSKCCNQELPGKIIGYKGGIRVCTYCCKVVLRYAQQSETTGDMTVTKEDLRVLSPVDESSYMGSVTDFGLWSPLLHKKMTSREDLSPQQSLLSPAAEGAQGGGSPVSVPFDLSFQSDFTGHENLDLERKILIQDSLQLREIWRQIQDPEGGVETQTHRIRLRTHQRCIAGRELVDWLLANDKAAKREQAVAIGQALLYAGYLESVGTQPSIFRDNVCIYKLAESSVQLPEETGKPETGLDRINQNNEPLWFKEIVSTQKDDSSFTTSDDGHPMMIEVDARKTFSSDSSPGLQTSTRPESSGSSSEVFKFQGTLKDLLDEPLPRQDSSSAGLSDDILKGALQIGCSSPTEALSPHGWRVVDHLREENGERLAYQRLRRQCTEHLTSLLQQLLSQAGLSQGWESIISFLMNQAARFVKPDVQIEADDMDIRKHIHIKKIPGGHREESELFHGVVFTKNIAHKKMQEEVLNPSVLLLKGSIEYQRVENKFSSLEPQILQEREFLRNSVSKVAKLQPQIVVVEKSVSRLAQEFLLEMGITLLFNVRPAVMERIARFTQADIVSSIDGLLSRPRLGMCHRFFCRTYAMPSGEPKTLAYFDGCATHLGCTIVLRHGSVTELRKVKEILRFMIYASYNSLLEISFYMDEFAMPRPHPEEDRAIELDPFDNGSQGNSHDPAAPSGADASKTDSVPGSGEVPDMEGQLGADAMQFDVSLDGAEPFASASMKFDLDAESSPPRRSSDFDVITESEAAQIQISEVSGSYHATPSPLTLPPTTPSSTQSQPMDTSTPGADLPAQTSDDAPHPELAKRARLLDPSAAGEEIKRCSTGLTELTELTDQSDPLHTYQRHKDDSIFQSDITLQEHKLKRHRQFQRVLGDLILSVSPYLQYQVPYLETEGGALCEPRRYLPEDIYWSPLFEADHGKKPRTRFPELDPVLKFPPKSNIEITAAHPLVLCKLTAPPEDRSLQTMLADFRARGGRIHVVRQSSKGGHRDPSPRKDTNQKDDTFPGVDRSRVGLIYEKKVDCLNPMHHQRLAVLFSSNSPKSPNHPNPCVYPWVVSMEFYGYNDISLAGFLHRFCFREAYLCPSESCDAPMMDHMRRFVHGKACISVLLRRLEHCIFTGREACISTWSWCKKCKQVTAVVPLSSDTANLSFAKYLELRFNGPGFLRRGSAQPCGHSLHHDHYQYFGYKTVVASFKYAEIQLLEIALPPMVVTLLQTCPSLERLQEGVKHVTNKGMDRFSSILESTLKLKTELQGEAQNKLISDFVTEQQKEKTRFREFALQLQQELSDLNELPSDSQNISVILEIHDKLVLLKKMIGEAVARWNLRIQDFLMQQQQQKKAKQQQSSRSSRDKEKEQSQEEVLEKSWRSVGGEDKGIPEIVIPGGTSSGDCLPSDSLMETPAADIKGSHLLLAPEKSQSVSSEGSSGGDDLTDSRASERRSTRRNFMPSFLMGSNYVPVTMPYDPSEHYLLAPPWERVPVVVYDQETSSIIAYALSCTDYHQHLREVQSCLGGTRETLGTSSAPLSRQNSRAADLAAAASESLPDPSRKGGSGVLSFFWGSTKDQSPRLARKSLINAVKYTPTDADAGEEDLENFSVTNREEVERSRNSKSLSNHIELQFSDGVAKFYCRVYFAEQFRKLRKLIFPDGEDTFIRSLSRCKPWEAKGGKSGSSFCKTDDDRFILKQMSWMEVESFEKFAPSYFQYITSAYTQKRPIALAKILGVYRIGFRNNQTNHALKQDVLVVENLFYNRKITQKFDLKGSMRNRLVNTSGKKEEELVLMDENLLKLSSESPLYIRPHSKTVLRAAITSDSSFLSTNLVMDYSLLVGIDDSKQELVVGIIDYIRTFTWDKKLEMVVKSTGRLVGQAKLPTVVSPELYRRRFLEAMDRYFLHVPDQWNGLGNDSPSMRNQGWASGEEWAPVSKTS